MKKNKFISLALNFTSFLVSRVSVDRVVLHGSIARGDFDKESDIDLFVETDKKKKKQIEKVLELYKKTKEYEKYKLGGIRNELAIKCGRLDDWKDLKRSIISSGVVLYGRFVDKPEGLAQKVLFILDISKLSRTRKMKIWRKVYGYKQKVGKKIYVSEGLVEERVGRGAFICSLENAERVLKLLQKEKIKYKLMEIWVG